jgi:hypothetical protein
MFVVPEKLKRLATRIRTSLLFSLGVELAEARLARLGEVGAVVIIRQIGVGYKSDLARFQIAVGECPITY